MAPLRRQHGQATVEWIGLVLLAALAAVGMAAAVGARLPGADLARLIAQRIACAAGIGDDCLGLPDSELVAEYGPELAEALRRGVPTMAYEDGMRALPVDFRRCREDPCSMGAEAGAVGRTQAGEPVTLFVHVVDCRGDAQAPAEEAGWNCAGERAGHLYVQYWAYYPGSQGSLSSIRFQVVSAIFWRLKAQVGQTNRRVSTPRRCEIFEMTRIAVNEQERPRGYPRERQRRVGTEPLGGFGGRRVASR